MNVLLTVEKTALIVVMSANFLGPFMSSAINLTVPSIGKEFGGNALLLSWLVAAYSLASAGFMLPCGKLSDIVGRKKIFMLGMYSFSAFTILSGLAWSIHSMIFFRACQGIASSLIFSTGPAIVASVYPPQARGRALGLTAACAYAGISLGPVIGGIMTYHFGWRSLFYATGLVCLGVTFLASWRLKAEWADAQGDKFDLPGSLCYVLALSASLCGLSSLFQSEWGKVALVSGLALLAVFFVYESKLAHPIFQVHLFRRNLVFMFSNLTALINFSATFAIAFLISLYLQVMKGYDPQVAGLVLISQPLIVTFLTPYFGALTQRVAPRILTTCGMGIITLGLSGFIFLTAATDLRLIIANMTLIGLGFALFAAPNNIAIMNSVEKENYGVASSMLGTMRLVGGAISMAIVTLIFSIYAGDSGLSRNDAGALAVASRIAFVIFTMLCMAGTLLSLVGKRSAKTAHQSPAPESTVNRQ